MSIDSPVFIVGVGRSGTSLLQSMLAAHPALAFPPETSFVRRFVASRRLERTLARTGWDGVETVLRHDARIERLGVDTGAMLEPFRTHGRRFSDALLYEHILLLHRDRAGKQRVGDKDPRLIEFLPVLRRYWPTAYVVQIVRDPRDVLASKKKATWSAGRPSVTHIFANRVQMKIAEREGRTLFGNRYRTVRYEKLLTDPEAILTLLTEWLEIGYDQRMLDFTDSAGQLVSESELPWKAETLGPLLSTNHGKWSADLSLLEIRATEIACRQQFGPGGYPLAADRRPFVDLAARAVATALMLAEPAYRLARSTRLRAGR